MSYKGEPVIQKCKTTENWTKVTFKPDLGKFNMTQLEDDVVALMKKRVVDLAGCLAACPGKRVKVVLNGKEIEAKTFHDYAQLYLRTVDNSRDRPLPRIDNSNKEDFNRRWQISVSLSDGQFHQVSFVNNINTIKGGTHVDYITAQITKFVIDAVKKKDKKAIIKPHIVKNHLWIFVNALIDNPAFDSQTKETLTTRSNSFGTTCELSYKFLKQVVDNSGVVESLQEWAEFKKEKDLKKTDGSKTRKLLDVPKLEDANAAGGRESHWCTLILTEGDSAKALAVSGLSVVGRNHYGVFPLRGKLLNVREASAKQITDNAEINYLKKILGLKQGEKYDKDDSVKQLRYGHLMIMADQDHDGSHIKGLVINFIHTFWPSLLRNPGFMLEFVTPIVKATRGEGDKKETVPFYNMPEYEEWIRTTGSNVKNWTIKYYKGLGTSSSNEGKEYFTNLRRHRKTFSWEDDSDGSAIELAFSKKKIEARKAWLREQEVGHFLDHADEKVRYSDFVHKELKLFSRADLARSIPSMVDGLKPTQRKVLFAAFKKNLTNEIKVAQFSGYVSEKSSYHHGEASIQTTIIGMAQNFMGANNINLFMPSGQFGTRNMGGKDAASPRYIHTALTEIARNLFPKEDDVLLNFLKEDGLTIEPVWYMPIIPMVLVNGAEGIGTGWSTFIPNYNPRDIIANIKRMLNDEPLVPMDPWYSKFRGTLERTARKETGITYTVTGIIEVVGEDDDGEDITLIITELPIRKWTQDYKEFLQSLAQPTEKGKEAFIKDIDDHSTNDTVKFSIILSKKNYNNAKQEGLLKKFRLTSTLSTSNMHLFDEENKIVRYENPEQILEKFYHMRLEFYAKRKVKYLEIYNFELLRLDNQVRFILGVVEGEIVVSKKKKVELVDELHERGFTRLPKKKPIESAVAGATDNVEETESTVDPASDSTVDPTSIAIPIPLSDYDYLLSMAIGSLTIEKVNELLNKRKKVEDQIEQLKKETQRSLWLKDLDALEQALVEKEKREEEEAKESLKEVKDSPNKNNKRAPRNKKNVTKAKPAKAAIPSTEPPLEQQVKGGKGRPGLKKAPAKKKDKPAVVENEEEEEDEIPDLRKRLAAYHLDSSPEKSTEMETDVAADATKKPLDEVEDISDDDVVEPVKKGRGRQANRKEAGAVTKKRGPAASKKSKAGQKLITDSFNLKGSDSTTETLPFSKVRRMRTSPFNKKSGSVLNRLSQEDGSASVDSGTDNNIGSSGLSSIAEMPARTRPQRANKKQMTYVLSDSDSDEAQKLSSDDDVDDSIDVDDNEDDESDFE